MRDTDEDDDRSMWKGAIAGAVGGLVASWVMNQFQAGLSKAAEAMSDSKASHAQGDGEDATMKAAETISEAAADRRLTKEEKQAAGRVIHYVFGSSIAAVYGALAEVTPSATTAWGLPFGAALWVGADEVSVPALGLSKSPVEYPTSTHVSALAAHLVYGVTTDLVRRSVRAAM